jgi:hypothetical protein
MDMTRYVAARHYLSFGIVAIALAGFSGWLGMDWAPAFIPAVLFLLRVPEWFPSAPVIDNWRTSAWERRSTGLPPSIFDGPDEHL